MDSGKSIGIPALVSFYEKLAQNNPHLRQLKASVDIGQIMPNVPQMGRFFTSLSAALQLRPTADSPPAQPSPSRGQYSA